MFSVKAVAPSISQAFTEIVPSTHRKHQAELDAMDLDEDEFGGAGPSKRSIVSPGEVITSSKEYMRGHGTYVEESNVVSSVAGTIERVNKLISVRPLRSRYTPEVGDLVIGRIVEVGAQRWRVDANGRQDAVLMLSSVNLPGGVQRRKIESDALKMREFLAEGDLLVAEVQAFFGDGAMSLHTRSLKYGKLRNGFLLTVPPQLIRRLKSHFYHIPPPCGPTGVDVILGLNGYVWVSNGTSQARREGGEGFDSEGVYSNQNDEIPPQGREAISLVANIIKALASEGVPLTETLIGESYAWAEKNVPSGSGPFDSETERKMLNEIVGLEFLEFA
ncbi:hypothetical protein CNBA0770 [Cryptococcus deneoformans B-3501A]|uniref:Exosome complex component RRP4 n=1 Tax=Cryptococcus deneoformans (strain JEC21 / ATCC MYA-565) TaxID=214684 RepID=Q5KQ17_CRYD1|nr:exosome complex exonuclease rrp4, putative [Cryptococcus neoformans var. neoformans JEC21]XP_778074.1 hypothetical protein CNBA0770 [Cryptococcus neoformans var. neoformans B-3501A]AAW40686.1 exosome complex exonuclease rrp4, putative [Cryptococcus neoformans var. neoformans JEC21]EAL23427.1 hypothetical protein CNBA0770 [Cryptococcus neoformans var. neoformans B-3501A]